MENKTPNPDPSPVMGKGVRAARVLRVGFYSPSQNGLVILPQGIAPCIAGGGKGHDVDKPKVLIEFA